MRIRVVAKDFHTMETAVEETQKWRLKMDGESLSMRRMRRIRPAGTPCASLLELATISVLSAETNTLLGRPTSNSPVSSAPNHLALTIKRQILRHVKDNMYAYFVLSNTPLSTPGCFTKCYHHEEWTTCLSCIVAQASSRYRFWCNEKPVPNKKGT